MSDFNAFVRLLPLSLEQHYLVLHCFLTLAITENFPKIRNSKIFSCYKMFKKFWENKMLSALALKGKEGTVYNNSVLDKYFKHINIM